MSNQEEQQMAETKPRIMTGFIHYGESDDLTKLFDILNDFRKNNGLKYSHQSKAQMVFFNVSSEHLDAFSKVRPFKISRFQTRTEYKCDEATSTQLMGQKDSFLRMMWDEVSGTISFQSRTPSRVHGNLVRRIFRDAGVDFQRDSYAVVRNFASRTERDGEENETEEQGEQTQSTQPTQPDQEATPEGFQRVEKKTRKPRTTTSTASKVVKETETKPKVRGTRASKAPKTNA
jgi:hypothetical protein